MPKIIPTVDREIDDVSTFKTWVARAKPGERCTYHYGNLMKDRQFNVKGDEARVRGQLDRLASAVMTASENGAVMLVQKRVDEGMCQYLAVRQ